MIRISCQTNWHVSLMFVLSSMSGKQSILVIGLIWTWILILLILKGLFCSWSLLAATLQVNFVYPETARLPNCLMKAEIRLILTSCFKYWMALNQHLMPCAKLFMAILSGNQLLSSWSSQIKYRLIAQSSSMIHKCIYALGQAYE